MIEEEENGEAFSLFWPFKWHNHVRRGDDFFFLTRQADFRQSGQQEKGWEGLSLSLPVHFLTAVLWELYRWCAIGISSQQTQGVSNTPAMDCFPILGDTRIHSKTRKSGTLRSVLPLRGVLRPCGGMSDFYRLRSMLTKAKTITLNLQLFQNFNIRKDF